MDSRGHWEQMGFNITKAIDLNNCIESDFEVFNKVVPGPNEQQATVSFYSHLKYHQTTIYLFLPVNLLERFNCLTA